MMQMKFTKDEIRTSLLNNRYDEVMATYLLLDEKRANLSVSSEIFLTLQCQGYFRFCERGWSFPQYFQGHLTFVGLFLTLFHCKVKSQIFAGVFGHLRQPLLNTPALKNTVRFPTS